jgi:hypothetical protein
MNKYFDTTFIFTSVSFAQEKFDVAAVQAFKEN